MHTHSWYFVPVHSYTYIHALPAKNTSIDTITQSVQTNAHTFNVQRCIQPSTVNKLFIPPFSCYDVAATSDSVAFFSTPAFSLPTSPTTSRRNSSGLSSCGTCPHSGSTNSCQRQASANGQGERGGVYLSILAHASNMHTFFTMRPRINKRHACSTSDYRWLIVASRKGDIRICPKLISSPGYRSNNNRPSIYLLTAVYTCATSVHLFHVLPLEIHCRCTNTEWNTKVSRA